MSHPLEEYFSSNSEDPNMGDASQNHPLSQYFTDQKDVSPEERKSLTIPDLINQGVNKTTRLATQGAIGAIQRQTAPLDIPIIAAQTLARNPVIEQVRNAEKNNPEFAKNLRESQSKLGRDIEDKFRKNLEEQDVLRKESKLNKFIQEQPLDVGSLIELGASKVGVDLKPQDASEMALRWIGFIKNPAKAQELMKNGLNPQNAKELFKTLAPSAKEVGRGAGVATALDYAAEQELGPVGTMMAIIAGDLAPSLAAKTASKAFEFAKNPVESTKNAIAKTVAKFTPRDKIELQKAIIQDFREAGIQPDLGTVSGNNTVKWIQSTLSQVNFTGKALEEFKKSLTKNIVDEYKKVASSLGESIYESNYEAGQSLKNGLTEARDTDLGIARDLYTSAKQRAGDAQVYSGNLVTLVDELEKELTPGSYKSGEQKAVLDILGKIKEDIVSPVGGPKGAYIKDLINDKIALNDAINYEVQGGAKKLLGQLVKEIDNVIQTHGRVDPKFAKEWTQANKKFGQHAKLFRGKVINDALKSQDPKAVLNKMNTPHGIKEIKKALSGSAEGRELFDSLARHKLDEVITKNMIDSTTGQLNFGTFSKLLEKGQNREIIKALLGPETFQQLEKIQKASGRLAETAQKFFNASKSGTYVADLAFAGQVVNSLINVLAGNPWPLMKTGGIYLAANQFSKLMTDPKFIRMVENLILESEKGTESSLKKAGTQLGKRAKEIVEPATVTTSKAEETQ